MRGIIDANLYTENLVDALFARLYVARQEFRLLIDLFDDTVEYLFLKWVDVNFGFLADGDFGQLRFRNVDADVNLVAFEKCGDGSVGSDDVAGTNVEHFDCGVTWRKIGRAHV